MTAKQQANKLVTNYLILFPEFYNDKEYDYNSDKAKQCALILVDEIIKILHTNMEDRYWQEVKREIEKL